jgi:hypothetical protein
LQRRKKDRAVAKTKVTKKTKKFMKRMKKTMGRLRKDVDKLKGRAAHRVAASSLVS